MEKYYFTQNFKLSKITAFKDYSNLYEKKEMGYDRFFSDGAITLPLYSRSSYKKDVKYFYSDTLDIGTQIGLNPYFKIYNTYITDKERHIDEHFLRPFSQISIFDFWRQIKISEDKITFKTYFVERNRAINTKYFKKSWRSSGLSINLKTGDFYTFSHNKINSSNINKHIRKNLLSSLSKFIDNHGLFNIEKTIEAHTKLYEIRTDKTITFVDVMDNFSTNFDQQEYLNVVHNIFTNILKVDVVNNGTTDFIYDGILKFFLTKKKIKTPDNYKYYLTTAYPTAKYLKKNDNKLISAILDRMGIKSKQMIKLLHEKPNINLENIYTLIKFFGKKDFHKYFSNLSSNLIIDTGNDYMFHFNDNECDNSITDKMKFNILKLLNEFALTKNKYKNHTDYFVELFAKYSLILDHIRILRQINDVFPDVDFNANTWDKFNIEHNHFTKLHYVVTNSYTIEYIFDQKLIKHVESPIVSFGYIYYPIILKCDFDYKLEGYHMHHCVGSYAEREYSVIISLRKESINGHNRVTCEFDANTNKLIQFRSFCNQPPPEEFIPVLMELNTRIQQYEGSIKSNEKIKTSLTKEQMFEKASNLKQFQMNELPF